MTTPKAALRVAAVLGSLALTAFAVACAGGGAESVEIAPTQPPPTAAPPTQPSVPSGDAWQPDVAYQWGDRVVYQGREYVAKWWSRGFEPDTPVANAWDTPWAPA